MNTKETALIGLLAAVSSLVFCQFLVQMAGHHAHLSSAQASRGIAICLAGVAVGLLLVLCVSVLEEAGSRRRSLGAFGLALGGALLLALLVAHRSPRAESTPRAARELAVGEGGTVLLAPGAWR